MEMELTVLVNDKNLKIINTSYQGSLNISYQDLVIMFGEPKNLDYKSDAAWDIYVPSLKLLFQIYNWKDGPNYLGKKGTPVHLIKTWNIGGKYGEINKIQTFLKKYQRIKRLTS